MGTEVKSEDSFTLRSDDHAVVTQCGDTNVVQTPCSRQEKKTTLQDECESESMCGHGHHNNQGSLYNCSSHLHLSSPYSGLELVYTMIPIRHCPTPVPIIHLLPLTPGT